MARPIRPEKYNRIRDILGRCQPLQRNRSDCLALLFVLFGGEDDVIQFGIDPSRSHDIHADLVSWRATFGYIPEEAHLYTWMSALEYLQLVGRLRGMGERAIRERAEGLLALLGLESWRFSPMSVYSKGMRQRVLMTAALMHDPEVLILDEPHSGLDVLSSRLFRDLLQELAAAGKAVLYISHVLEIVEQVCDRVIVVAEGRIVADAPPGELTGLMKLPSLEKVFAQLVRQQDTRSTAREIVEVMRPGHGRG